MRLGFVLAALSVMFLSSSVVRAQTSPHLPEVAENVTGFASVAQALATLKNRRDVSFSMNNGWTIVSDEKNRILWSFSPISDPSYPSVVKRSVVTENGATYINTAVECEASKDACDHLVRQFNELTRKVGRR